MENNLMLTSPKPIAKFKFQFDNDEAHELVTWYETNEILTEPIHVTMTIGFGGEIRFSNISNNKTIKFFIEKT